MAMEKRGVVEPGRTPDTEHKLAGVKEASTKGETRRLDEDFTKRAADAAAHKLQTEQRGT